MGADGGRDIIEQKKQLVFDIGQLKSYYSEKEDEDVIYILNKIAKDAVKRGRRSKIKIGGTFPSLDLEGLAIDLRPRKHDKTIRAIDDAIKELESKIASNSDLVFKQSMNDWYGIQLDYVGGWERAIIDDVKNPINALTFHGEDVSVHISMKNRLFRENIPTTMQVYSESPYNALDFVGRLLRIRGE